MIVEYYLTLLTSIFLFIFQLPHCTNFSMKETIESLTNILTWSFTRIHIKKSLVSTIHPYLQNIKYILSKSMKCFNYRVSKTPSAVTSTIKPLTIYFRERPTTIELPYIPTSKTIISNDKSTNYEDYNNWNYHKESLAISLRFCLMLSTDTSNNEDNSTQWKVQCDLMVRIL